MQGRPKSRREIRARGQNMLVSEKIADRLVDASEITSEDTVLEIGAGTGMITKRLAQKAKSVISFEIDDRLFHEVKRILSFRNVDIRLGDAFKSADEIRFDVCVTSLPYSESLKFIKWLSLRSGTFRSCVAIVQSEFADKISSESGKRSYRAISVIAQNSFEIERLFSVQREEFDPPPTVLSEAIRLTPRKDISQPFFDAKRMAITNQLFSFRGRLLSAAIKKLARRKDSLVISRELLKTRVEDLTPSEFAVLIPKLEL